VIVQKTEPKETPIPTKTETEKPAVTEMSAIPTSTFLDILKNINWKYIVFTIVGVAFLGIIVFVIRLYINRDKIDYQNYNNQDIR
jgi:hypothetical protein